MGWYRSWGKRALDLVLVFVSSPITVPVILATAVWVRLSLGPGVFFRQTRPGLNGKPFTMIKFRTMLETRGADGNLLPDDQRLTSFGRLLRSTSLDELPELWNVVRGEMSLVGPRPLLMRYLSRYTPQQYRRHEVFPGITGWAQVHGRNAISWEEKFDLDVWYVDHHSLAVDVLVLWRTITGLLRRHGVSAEGSATMPEFMGTPQTDNERGESP